MSGQWDLFSLFRPNNPETSKEAAKAVAPKRVKIRDRVLEYARDMGAHGITDAELVERWPDAPESSYRKRRTELVQDGKLVDSGRTRLNKHGRRCVVWIVP